MSKYNLDVIDEDKRNSGIPMGAMRIEARGNSPRVRPEAQGTRSPKERAQDTKNVQI